MITITKRKSKGCTSRWKKKKQTMSLPSKTKDSSRERDALMNLSWGKKRVQWFNKKYFHCDQGKTSVRAQQRWKGERQSRCDQNLKTGPRSAKTYESIKPTGRVFGRGKEVREIVSGKGVFHHHWWSHGAREGGVGENGVGVWESGRSTSRRGLMPHSEALGRGRKAR